MYEVRAYIRQNEGDYYYSLFSQERDKLSPWFNYLSFLPRGSKDHLEMTRSYARALESLACNLKCMVAS